MDGDFHHGSDLLVIDVDFMMGAVSGSTVALSLTINDDCRIEYTETFFLSIADNPLYTTGTISSNDVSIMDDDCKLTIRNLNEVLIKLCHLVKYALILW